MTSTTNKLLLLLIVGVVVISAAPALHYTSQDFDRDSGTDVVGSTSGGILNINQIETVYYGLNGQTLTEIENPTSETQTVTVSLNSLDSGWTLSNGQSSRTVTLSPGQSAQFSVSVSSSRDPPTTAGYSIRSSISNDVSSFSKQLSVQITQDWDYIVDSDGTADFTTIQAAVDAAASGDKIRVDSGTYPESVQVTKPLLISGVSASPHPVVAGTNSYGFSIEASDVVLQSFTIDASTVQDGIRSSSSGTSGTVILDTDISGASRACFYTQSASVRKITASTFRDCGTAGVYGSDAILKNLSYNTIKLSDAGIRWEAKNSGGPGACTGPPKSRPDYCDSNSGTSNRIIQSAHHNILTDNQESVYLETWDSSVFSYNRIDGATSGDGLTISGTGSETGTIRATNNYWGASDGPSGGITDPQTGAVANGGGDVIIISNKGSVRFDPWLNIAPTDVGDPE